MSLLRRVLGPPDVKKHLERRDVARLIDDLHDRDAAIRASAATALGKLADSKAAPALIEAFEDSDKTVTDAATDALSAMHPDVIELFAPILAEGKTWTRADRGARAAVTAISSREFETAVPALRELLRHSDWRVRHVGREALASHGEAAVPHATAALGDTNLEARKAAAEILGELKSADAVHALIPLLSDNDVTVRESAASALGKIGNEQAANALIDLVRDSSDPPRTAAVIAIGRLHVAEAVQPLVDAMDNGSDRLVGHIAEALSRIRDPAAVAPLRSALEKTKSIEARELILSTLALLGDPSVKPMLLSELSAEEARLKQRLHLDADDFKLVKSVIGSLALIEGDDVVAELTERLNSPFSYDVVDRDERQRFYPIRDAARAALALMGSRDEEDPLEGDRPISHTNTFRFEIGR